MLRASSVRDRGRGRASGGIRPDHGLSLRGRNGISSSCLVRVRPFGPTFFERDVRLPGWIADLPPTRRRVVDAGSREGRERQPTCHFVQVIIGRATAKAGDYMGASAPMFFFRATPHNLARSPSLDFWLNSKFGKRRNTVCTRKGYAASVSQLTLATAAQYFSFFKLKKWGIKTAAARRHNCAVLP